ncbi:hypothetical protein CXP39_03490 [Mesoplasma syrphidae]|uniref:Uncharacterized protein n=1 Tax=Mesoplasma syrphidae TaxID=225999 RepID=A0A2K9BZP5_9MOLU|nr:hypothetical protein [Mesoplasma syrphidae]AUF83828.1 hypothetical protein CXP39_03490 [Mesoplasma syrphidae]
MLLADSVSNQNVIVGTSLAVIGAIIAAVFLWLYFWQRKKAERRGDFHKYKQESKTVWDFMKKNFVFYVFLFGLVMFVTGFVTAIF